MFGELLFEIKPKYVESVCICNSAVWGVCSIMWYILFGAVLVMLTMPLAIFMENPNAYFDFLVYYTVHLSILPPLFMILLTLIISLYVTKKNYEVTNYKVYTDVIEFEEGFINHKHKIIRLKDIKEVHLSQNFFQKKVELGTIRLVTAAGNNYKNGVFFYDITNPLAIYTKIKQLANV